MKRAIFGLILCAWLFIPGMASAETNAREYIAPPPGTLLSMLYYQHISGESLYADGNKVAHADLDANVGLFREVYYFNLGPFLGAAHLIIPFGDQSLDIPSANDIHLSASGVGDPILLGSFFFINRPSTKTYLAFSPYFFFPVGNYSNDGALTMGENRWRFREEVNFTQGFEVIPNHNAYFEVLLGGDFLTDNDDYGPNSATMSQDPIFNLESHLSYDLTKDWWIAADFYGHWGGEKTVDHVSFDSINTQTVGGTLAYNLTPGWQVLFQYKGDVAVENGIPAQTFLVRLLYATDIGKLCH